MPKKHPRTSAEVDPNRVGESGPSDGSKPELARLTYRLADLVEALGISRRTLERERSAGRFPAPDLSIGKAPLWKVETIRRWIDGGGK